MRYILLLIGCLIFIQCDWISTSAKSDTVKEYAPGPMMPINIEKEGTYESLDQIRAEAKALIEHRKETDPYPFTLLTDSYWTWAGFFDGQFFFSDENIQGHWIKFYDNFTYHYGYMADITGAGTYHFRMKDNILIMLDDNTKYQPKELIFSDGGSSIMFGGRPGFQLNNGMQMKMDPHSEKPF